MEMIEEAYGGQIHLFESRIPKSVQVGYSILHNKSILEFNRKNKVSIAYEEFAKEVLNYGRID